MVLFWAAAGATASAKAVPAIKSVLRIVILPEAVSAVFALALFYREARHNVHRRRPFAAP
jgi:hypothetical protein